MDKKKLRQEKVQRQQQLLNAAKQGNRALNVEENAEFEALQREIDDLTRQIEEEERQQSQNNPNQNTGEEGIQAERQRASEITVLCREFNMDPQTYIQNGTSVEGVRTAILDNMRANRSPISTRGTGEISVIADSEDKFRAAASDALIMRGGIVIAKPADGARDLMGMSLRDFAIEVLNGENIPNLNRKSNDELFNILSRQFYNPTAAFPSILDQAINKSYVEGHNKAPVTFDKWAKKGTLTDFKTVENKYLAGPAGEFLEVPEGGELKHDLPSDEKLPTRKLKTYGRQFTMTRQAFINDDIDFLSKIPSRYAASARKTQNKQVYQILVKNPAIYDGKALFSTEHKNLMATGTGITAESVQKMFMALQLQTDQFGEAIIIRPATIIVPVGYAFAMYTMLQSPTINTADNTQAANPLYIYKDSLQIVEDPTLNVLCGDGAMPWFIVGDGADTDSIQVDYLNGQEIPTIRRMETPGQLGFVWDIYLDWGISVMDYRGIVKNPGIKLSL
ncbi:phage major capsid protein [Clostridium saccharoperbutylacetonicum]